MPAKRLAYCGDWAIRDDGHALNLLVVIADKMHVRGETSKTLPSRESH